MKRRTLIIVSLSLVALELLFIGYTSLMNRDHAIDVTQINKRRSLQIDYPLSFIPVSTEAPPPRAAAKSKASVTWRNEIGGCIIPEGWDEFKRNVPLTVYFQTRELAIRDGERRFDVRIIYRLNKADPLYKPGQRILICSSDSTGAKVEGDLTEYAYQFLAIVDDNQPEAAFSYRIKKGNSSSSHQFRFWGGVLRENVQPELNKEYIKRMAFDVTSHFSSWVRVTLLAEPETPKPYYKLFKE